MIKVLKPGLYTSIQDFGRMGFQHYGVPCSGVMDKKAASMANLLLGNHIDDAVLEITMIGPVLQFAADTCIVISGAELKAKLNSSSIKLNKVIRVKANDVISFGKRVEGARSYLAVYGGFNTETVMNSKSMYQNVTSRFVVHKNDKLPIAKFLKVREEHYASIRFGSAYIRSNDIEVFRGPEFELLTQEQQEALFVKAYAISKHNNRMAYQLNERLENDLKPIITSPVLPGTVQLTPSGKLIILMRDCQTTGGYPRVLQLSEDAIHTLAQKFTGQTIQFKLNSKY